MPIATLAAVAIGAAALAVGLYHAAYAAPRFARLQRTLRGEGSTEAESLAILRAAHDRTSADADRRLRAIEADLGVRASRLGFVRYDSFKDAGPRLSYSLALLDGRGDGVVLTSIYSREETRSYAKGVAAYATVGDASGEELEAIAAVRSQEAFVAG